MLDFKHTKFRKADDTTYIIREALSHIGYPIIFKVSGHDLSTLVSEKVFPDFDTESDNLIKKLDVLPETGQVYFEWIGRSFHKM